LNDASEKIISRSTRKCNSAAHFFLPANIEQSPIYQENVFKK
jgi:hypothetical protein